MEQYGRFAEVYDPLMQDVDYDAWGRYVATFIDGAGALSGAPRVAECACGTGALTLRLAQHGYQLTCTDASEAMLRVASEKLRRAGKSVQFIRQDMRELRLHRQADAVVCACDGVNYLASLRDVKLFFRAAHAALRPLGRLIFDISSRYKLQHVLGMNTFAEDDGERAYIWKNNYDEASKLIEMQLSFFVKLGGTYERFTETHIQRAHSEAELASALNDAGFCDIAAYEAFTLDAPNEETQRIQFVAVKSE